MSDRHYKRKAHNFIDLTDQRFGKLVVLYDTGRRKSKKPIWKCRCECGNEPEIMSKYLRNGDTRSCGCIAKGNAHNRGGYGDLGASYFNHCRNQAVRRGIPFEITAKDAWELFERQERKCALTGDPIVIVVNYTDERLNQTASLDRKDNSKGYTPDNIQWVHKRVNIMRNTMSVPEFVAWCKKIVEHAA